MAARTGARRRPYFNLPEAESARRRLIAGTQHETIAGHVGKELYAELRRLARRPRGRDLGHEPLVSTSCTGSWVPCLDIRAQAATSCG